MPFHSETTSYKRLNDIKAHLASQGKDLPDESAIYSPSHTVISLFLNPPLSVSPLTPLPMMTLPQARSHAISIVSCQNKLSLQHQHHPQQLSLATG